MKLKQFRLPRRHLAILAKAVASGEYSTESDAVRASIENLGLELELRKSVGALA